MTSVNTVMWETRHSTADWVLIQDSDFAGDLEDSKSTSGGVLCIFGRRTFVPMSWMCKKQTSVSHSSTESELISLDAGLRMDGLLALDLWDFVIEVLRSNKDNNQPNHTGLRKLPSVQPKHTSHQQTGAVLDSKTKTPTYKRTKKVDQVFEVDHVPTNTRSSQSESQLYLCWR